VTGPRVEDNRGGFRAAIEGDMVMLLVAGDGRGGSRIGCGRRGHDRGQGRGGLSVIRYFVRARRSGRTKAGLPCGAHTMGPEGPGVGPVGLTMPSRALALAASGRAIALAAVAMSAQREQRAAVAGLADEQTERERASEV